MKKRTAEEMAEYQRARRARLDEASKLVEAVQSAPVVTTKPVTVDPQLEAALDEYADIEPEELRKGVTLHDLQLSHEYKGKMRRGHQPVPSRWNQFFREQSLVGKPGEPNPVLVRAMNDRKRVGLGPLDRAIVFPDGRIEWDEGFSETRRGDADKGNYPGAQL